MLDVALGFLVRELNSYLLLRTGQEFGSALACRLVDDTGKTTIPQDRLAISLIHVEEERVFRAQLPQTTLVNGVHVQQEPELKLNVFVLLAAQFQQYDQALKYLSLGLAFFQSHSVFTTENAPALDTRIGRLTAELQSLNFEQLNQIWAFVGGKQLPSALYKLRMLVLQDQAPSGLGPPILTVNIRGQRV